MKTPTNSGRSPWGQIQIAEVLAAGLIRVHTAGHGGLWVSPDKAKAAENPGYLRPGVRWYEEDCEALRVMMAFPSEFPRVKDWAALERDCRHWMDWTPSK